ncbi:unnamed protein product [Sphagnum jensenii]|uniref:Uncharacterized protein n=1 Tax=Sphagnum jensenii TaxID=128206 RepID=A0ABP1ALR6_9BRYO
MRDSAPLPGSHWVCEFAGLSAEGQYFDMCLIGAARVASYHELSISRAFSVAFSERTVLESILGAEDLQTSGHLKDVLGLIRTLYVLSAADQAPVS